MKIISILNHEYLKISNNACPLKKTNTTEEHLSNPAAKSKYRAITGDNQYDELLMNDANAYVKFRLGNDRQPLLNALKFYGSAIQNNVEAYTSEVRHTDRVLAFNDNFRKKIDPSVPSSREIAQLL